MKIIFVIILFLHTLIFLPLNGFALDENNPNIDDATEAQMMKSLMEAQNGRFILEGSISDSEGRPLDGVTMKIEAGSMDVSQQYMTSSKDWTQTVDKNFKLDLDGYCGISLSFSKDGYYQTKRYDFSTETDECQAKIMAGEKAIVSNKDLSIVMYKIDSLASLTTYNAILVFATDGSGAILDLGKAPSQALIKTANVKVGKKDIPDGVYIISEINSGGIASEERETYEAKSIFTYPKKITIITADEDGGFIKFDPKEGVPVNVQMNEAPQEGYKREIVVTSDDLLKQVEATFPNDLGNFYFKINGKYGKGSYGLGEVSKDGKSVTLGVGFRLQTDGTRNLETSD